MSHNNPATPFTDISDPLDSTIREDCEDALNCAQKDFLTRFEYEMEAAFLQDFAACEIRGGKEQTDKDGCPETEPDPHL